MDKDIFDSICARYEARINMLEEKLNRAYSTEYQSAKVDVCIKHGGHEFDSRCDVCGQKVCKFCGFTEQRRT